MSKSRANRTPVEETSASAAVVRDVFQRFTAAFDEALTSAKAQYELDWIRRRIEAERDFDVSWPFQAFIWGTISHLLRTELRPMFADLDASDRDRVLQQIGDFAAKVEGPGVTGQRAAVTWCEYHGYVPAFGRRPCEECPCEPASNFGGGWADPRFVAMADYRLVFPHHHGRRPKYCSNACRQRAYRRRRATRARQSA
ncbi:hypothetical protein [Nocardia puris]|uniref:hypothetical protein n=1 Tax=Nocardia puris TaxID=208602 RepID=UPI000A92B3B5|nr:hypothetical protein [Nocardia puris]